MTLFIRRVTYWSSDSIFFGRSFSRSFSRNLARGVWNIWNEQAHMKTSFLSMFAGIICLNRNWVTVWKSSFIIRIRIQIEAFGPRFQFQSLYFRPLMNHIDCNTWAAKFFVDSDHWSLIDEISKQATSIKGKKCSAFLVYNLISDSINEQV